MVRDSLLYSPASTSTSFAWNFSIALLRAFHAFGRLASHVAKGQFFTSQSWKSCLACSRISTHAIEVKLGWFSIMVCWVAFCTLPGQLRGIRLRIFFVWWNISNFLFWVGNNFILIYFLIQFCYLPRPWLMMNCWIMKVICRWRFWFMITVLTVCNNIKCAIIVIVISWIDHVKSTIKEHIQNHSQLSWMAAFCLIPAVLCNAAWARCSSLSGDCSSIPGRQQSNWLEWYMMVVWQYIPMLSPASKPSGCSCLGLPKFGLRGMGSMSLSSSSAPDSKFILTAPRGTEVWNPKWPSSIANWHESGPLPIRWGSVPGGTRNRGQLSMLFFCRQSG